MNSNHSGPIFCHMCGTLMINTGDDVLECSACNARQDASGNKKEEKKNETVIKTYYSFDFRL